MSDRCDEVSPRVDFPRHLWAQPIVFFVTSCFVFSHVSEFFLSRNVASEAAPVQTKQSKAKKSLAKQTTNPPTQLGIEQRPRDFQVGLTLWST
jgi:hypothetical protein